MFKRGALQPGLFVQQPVVKLADDRLQRLVELSQVRHPTHRRQGLATHRGLDPERVAVQARVGAAGRSARGQAVRRVEAGGLGDFENGGVHEARRAAEAAMPQATPRDVWVWTLKRQRGWAT